MSSGITNRPTVSQAEIPESAHEPTPKIAGFEENIVEAEAKRRGRAGSRRRMRIPKYGESGTQTFNPGGGLRVV